MAFINTGGSTDTGIQQGSKFYIVLLTLVATFGGLLFGYDTAVVNGAEKSLVDFYITPMLDPANYGALTHPIITQYRILMVVVLLIVAVIISIQMFKLLGKKRGGIFTAVAIIGWAIWSWSFIGGTIPTDSLAIQGMADTIKGFVIASALVGCVVGGGYGWHGFKKSWSKDWAVYFGNLFYIVSNRFLEA